MVYALGVDIGGTKVAAVIIDEHGKIHSRTEVPSNQKNREKMFDQVTNSVEMVLEKSNISLSDIKGMGVGIPGKVDREKGIAIFQNNLPWRNFPIVERIQNYFQIEQVVIDNDVYMAALAEWKLSQINKQDTFVYVTVSTGISSSIIHNGSFLRGDGFAGEIGFLPVLAESSPSGIETLENSASGPAIEKLAQKKFGSLDITTEEFFLVYQKGNPIAQTIMNKIVDCLAQGVYSIICLLDPHKITFGGGVMNNHPYLLDLVKEKMNCYVSVEHRHTLKQMKTSNLKGNSGVVGAGLKIIESSSS